MSRAWITIRLDENGRVRAPGETLAGSYALFGLAADAVKAVEVSVLWHTEGKGDEDLAVHHFERIVAEEGGVLTARRPGRFRTVLPQSPLSYEGAILKIRWCVRVRVFLAGGKEMMVERGFRLGDVPPAARGAARERTETAVESPEPALDAAFV
jgi:hypothetical protein